MVSVTPVTEIGADARGTTHVFDNDRTGQLMVTYRVAGSVSGRHYHTGRSPHKNPERLVLMSGTAVINWLHIETKATGSCTATAPAIIEIQPLAWHEVVAQTDIAVLELNSLKDGRGDTFNMEGNALY
ncbi:polysaccharide biosynthesis C-terminal domain-containing protein [Deminuibacter soli]|uniref:Capsular polysaccharide assembling protein CapF C-terminal domain-containing protein n=1 Tax=Deminuibacter soli TaxID=2291815 RepID=A0A3E1NJ62_9BACT|nr:hypothetical protein [Deminuibacter soli]RFM27962.1 hypothetical protein DXN05_10475 [Deminuibacter soli]